ncbi:MAG: hydroxymethylglutaryl-CoA lyase [Gammaproteobacteria bacterium]|nr:MAG: hydroxymethylglutaryl-CoA lyase [Gammaproteobacteria bacterium]
MSKIDISITEVGARDGLQNEKQKLAARTKIELIHRLSQSGLRRIEAGSFVSPKWVPQMANSLEVMQGLSRLSNVEYSALVPNIKGLEMAVSANADRVSIFTAASEAFCQKNINCSIAESIERFTPVVNEAIARKIPVRGYVSCIGGCPYQGDVPCRDIISVSERLVALGCDEISLGDTIGTGTANQIKTIFREVSRSVPLASLVMHFHDTYGQALANTYACLELGVTSIDSAVAGLGGCPYARGASGNLATEDLVYLLHGLGLNTGIDLAALIDAGNWVCKQLNICNRSKVSLAMSDKIRRT